MHCFLLREHRSQKALLEAGIGKDISGSYDSSTYQPIFSIVAKNANEEQKAEFVKVIEDTLKGIVENGMDKKHWKRESITMNSVTVKQTSEAIRRD